MYIPNHFSIYELTPPEMGSLIQKKGPYWAWSNLFDERLLITMDYLRTQWGRMVVNDWHNGGRIRYRGFRPNGCDVGADYSQHRFGRAVDMIPIDMSVSAIRDDILYHQDSPRYHHIGGLELDVDWLHIDVRQRINDKILAFKP